jgi:hypothetical protein
MLNMMRLSNYPGFFEGGITGPQARRMKHKQFSRKTHEHKTGVTCETCKPGWKPARLRKLEQQP